MEINKSHTMVEGFGLFSVSVPFCMLPLRHLIEWLQNQYECRVRSIYSDSEMPCIGPGREFRKLST